MGTMEPVQKSEKLTIELNVRRARSGCAYVFFGLLSGILFITGYFGAPVLFSAIPALTVFGEPLFLAAALAAAASAVSQVFNLIPKANFRFFPFFNWLVITTASILGIALQNEAFIKAIPSIVMGLSVVRGVASFMFDSVEAPIPRMKDTVLTEKDERRLTIICISGYAAIGLLNIVVWRALATDIWVLWRYASIVALLAAFFISQRMFSTEKKEKDNPVAKTDTGTNAVVSDVEEEEIVANKDEEETERFLPTLIEILSWPLIVAIMIWGFFYSQTWVSWIPLLAHLGSPLIVAFALSAMARLLVDIVLLIDARLAAEEEINWWRILWLVAKVVFAGFVIVYQQEMLIKTIPSLLALLAALPYLTAYLTGDPAIIAKHASFRLDARIQKLEVLCNGGVFFAVAIASLVVALTMPNAAWVLFNVAVIFSFVLGPAMFTLIFLIPLLKAGAAQRREQS